MKPKSELQPNADASEFIKFVQAIRRYWGLILVIVIAVTAAAGYFGSQQEAVFTARAQIVLEPDSSNNSASEFVAGSLSTDDSAIETQIKLLRTSTHIDRVITSLNLEDRWAESITVVDEDDAEPNGLERILQAWGLEGVFQAWGTAIAGLASTEQPEQAGQQPAILLDNATLMGALSRHFKNNYRIQQEGDSYVISIYYTSEDPVEAAEIANKSAEVFIADKRFEKLGVTDRTSQWLSKRAQTLFHDLQALEAEIAQFRKDNPITVRQSEGANNEIAFLLSELAATRGTLSTKRATWALAQITQDGQGNLQDIAEINTSPNLQNLFAEQRTLLAREAELSRTYGDRHPLMIQHRAEQERLDIKINQEASRIVASIENDVRILEARRDSLEQQITDLRQEEASKANVTFKLEDLIRRADDTRNLYREVLQRSKEINEQQEIVEPDVRLVSSAAVPRDPSSLGGKIFAVIGFCGSSIVSVMLALLLDRLDKRIRTPGQIEEHFGLETAALVPEVRQSPKLTPQQRLIELPRSIYADSMRSIYIAIRQAKPKNEGAKVVLTTSSLPDEGKSTLSLSLATAVAMQKKNVLIMDMDLRHPQLHAMSRYKPENGIVEYCRDSEISLQDCIYHDEELGLHYLFVNDLPHDPSATISSDRFPALLEELRKDFDLIVIDAAPVLAVTETRFLLAYVDLVTFCIRWGRTDIETAAEALSNIQNHENSLPILTVLTRVNMDKGASYGLSSSRHRKSLKKYYQDG